MESAFVLGPAKIAVGNGESVYGRIAIDGGRITDVLTGDGPSDVRVAPGVTIAPGMIDIHTNGAEETLFNRDQGNAVDVASRAYAARGATGFVATIMTAPWESMLHAAENVAETAHALAERPAQGARCLGIHIEGPFLNPKYRRVHRNDWLLPATAERVESLIEACRGALAMMTMAPEVDGVDRAVPLLTEQGVVCSAGHTAARSRDGQRAIETGFRTLTHVFNAMPSLDHREPSILTAFMQDERTSVQAICDGFHVAPEMIDLLYRILGKRLVLASDYMAPAGNGYRIEGGVMRAEDGTIAGSALDPDRAVRNLMAYARVPFEHAIACATYSPAKVLGIAHESGTLAPGKRADIALWNERYDVMTTFVAGEVVYGSEHVMETRTHAG